jgi:hypothetical protein
MYAISHQSLRVSECDNRYQGGNKNEKMQWGYQFGCCTNAIIFCSMMVKSRAMQFTINKPGEESWGYDLGIVIDHTGGHWWGGWRRPRVIGVAGLWGVGRGRGHRVHACWVGRYGWGQQCGFLQGCLVMAGDRWLYLCSGQWGGTDWSFWQSASILFVRHTHQIRFWATYGPLSPNCESTVGCSALGECQYISCSV